MFVSGEPFQPSLLFVGKVNPRVEHMKGALHGEVPTLLTYIIDQAVEACQGQTDKLITKICKLRTKKFYNIGQEEEETL